MTVSFWRKLAVVLPAPTCKDEAYLEKLCASVQLVDMLLLWLAGKGDLAYSSTVKQSEPEHLKWETRASHVVSGLDGKEISRGRLKP